MSNKGEKHLRKFMRQAVGEDARKRAVALVNKAKRAIRVSWAKTIIIALLLPANVWAVIEFLKGIK